MAKAFSQDTLHSVKHWADSLERMEIAVREAENKYNSARYFFMANPSQNNMYALQRALEHLNREREQMEQSRRNFEREVLNAEPVGA